MRAERDNNWAVDKPDQDLVEDWQLVQRLREGDAAAGHDFVQQHYPGVYHYLLYLTGRPELAEDLTQETFLQAWRCLHTFAGRAPLRLWLHRIACREFLQAVRRPRSVVRLEEVSEVEATPRADWAEAMVLQEAIRQLPPDQQQVIVLHYLQGYDCQEIGQILRAPIGTVKYWLSLARTHLQRELGEGDLAYLNEASMPMRQWAWLPLDQMYALETRLGFSNIVPRSTHTEETMERREFLRQAAVDTAGLMLSEREKEIVDSRLTQRVTCAFKGTALSDLCEHLRTNSGVHLVAGNTLADQKVTLFCQKLLLREVMRQLSRPFGYTWLRSGTSGEYRYELVQDLRSQLLEEELRNRDRHAALMALDKAIEQYRPYLDLGPDEARARARTAEPAEKTVLEQLGGRRWGAVQMYYRLSRHDLAALRAGEELKFSAEPEPDEQMLPPDVAHGVLQTMRDVYLTRSGERFTAVESAAEYPEALPPAAVTEARAHLRLALHESEVGVLSLESSLGYFASVMPGRRPPEISQMWPVSLAVSRSPALQRPGTCATDSRTARALCARVTVRPDPSSRAGLDATMAEARARKHGVSSADALEALHHATALPVVADSYTRLFPPENTAVQNLPLSEALSQLAEALGLRWSMEGNWLQFRSARYYQDHLKEVPNRQLSRWAASRCQHGALTLDDLIEIGQLPDAQLDAAEMAEGARECWGLVEWDLARPKAVRPHLRYLAELTLAQRREAVSAVGLPFTRMSFAQQQRFLAFSIPPSDPGFQSLEPLAGATLRVDYSLPGWFEWVPWGQGWFRWVVPTGRGTRMARPPIHERTREAALEAARQYFAQFGEPMLQAMRRLFPEATADQLAPRAAHIVPTRLGLQLLYVPGTTHDRSVLVVDADGNDWRTTWD